jgi:hypothetical protein
VSAPDGAWSQIPLDLWPRDGAEPEPDQAPDPEEERDG